MEERERIASYNGCKEENGLKKERNERERGGEGTKSPFSLYHGPQRRAFLLSDLTSMHFLLSDPHTHAYISHIRIYINT